MNSIFRRVVLALSLLIAGYVGIWAQFFPEQFYSSFPGLGLHWIDVDGPYNEHLIRDVGSLYLALGAASMAGLVSRSATAGRVAGLAWTVFGVLHFGYHLMHLEGSTTDRIGNVVSLSISLLVGVVLLFPARRYQTKKSGSAESGATR